jgi:hypothetical protein
MEENMNDLERMLKASIVIEEQKKLIAEQSEDIKQLRVRIRLLELKQHKLLEAAHGLPSLLREA